MQKALIPDRPVFITERLLLRPFVEEDAERVQTLAGEKQVSRLTSNIPHPYSDGLAEAWIRRCGTKRQQGKGETLAVTKKDSGELVGAINIEIDRPNLCGEIGYWIGVPYWGCGYATEAARALVNYAFVERGLHRVHGKHLACNLASGRVLAAVGFQREGVLRQHDHRPWGFEDVVVWGVLKPDWNPQ